MLLARLRDRAWVDCCLSDCLTHRAADGVDFAVKADMVRKVSLRACVTESDTCCGDGLDTLATCSIEPQLEHGTL